MKIIGLLVGILLWGALYLLTVRSSADRGNRPFILAGVLLALVAYFLSPVLKPMRDIFGPTILVPAVWMLLLPFRPLPEYYWTSPFLLLLGLYSILSGRTILGILSLLLSPVPLIVGTGLHRKVASLLRRETEAKVEEAESPTPSRTERTEEVPASSETLTAVESSGGRERPAVESPVEVEDIGPPVVATPTLPTKEERPKEKEPEPPQRGEDSAPTDEEVERTKRAILSKLAEFGIRGEIVKVSRGPVLTLYEFVPAPGVKVSSVVSREDDLHVSLGKPVRIVAPLPNGHIGIEVPNDRRKVFTFKDAEPYLKLGGPVDVPIGVDVSGKPYVFNLHKAPHVLIGGATGSGKSVLLTTLILGLIKKNTPETLRLVLIDPKMVELSAFEGLPHLLLPVAKMVPQAVSALRLVVNMMTERYALMSSIGTKDIESYNGKAKRLKLEPMPYVVVVVDELADLMMLSPKETVESIQRLAQLARAVGIHMVVATQRPSVDVVKPVIKANFPTRIALKVASRFDSRTILDRDGAERLLGKGDMLVLTPDRPDPVRVHGYYTSPKDVRQALISWITYRLSREWRTPYVLTERFVRQASEDGVLSALFRSDEPAHEQRMGRLKELFSKIFNRDEEEAGRVLKETLEGYYPYSYEEEEGGGEVNLRKLDPLILKAAEVFVQEGYASTSLLQRRLEIGYPRAAKIVDQLERLGFLSKAEGKSRPRKVMMSVDELRRIIKP
ncbi:MAG: DNA translocase FtsK [Thermotogae bacterium]|nr:DNA translocase FtsK [Thermotogota bacterium]